MLPALQGLGTMRQFAKRLLLIGCAVLGMMFIIGPVETVWAAPHESSSDHSPAAVEGGEHESGHHPNYNSPPLIPDMTLLVFSLVLFGGFVLFMRPAVWGPLMDSLNAREQRIEKAQAQARSALHDAEQLAAQAERRMAEVHNQVAKILATARHEAEVRKAEIISQAETEADQLKSEAINAIVRARDEAIRDLDQLVEGQVGLAFNQVTGRQ